MHDRYIVSVDHSQLHWLLVTNCSLGVCDVHSGVLAICSQILLTIDGDSSAHPRISFLSHHIREKQIPVALIKWTKKRKGRKRELKVYRNHLGLKQNAIYTLELG